ncbi:AAA family ATPase [Bradyrhizobium sp. CB2312]|uniref:trifunctional serine/threonine-protein kinase/ATP-binding protein/sensor histidine kinase n=1 Tax=Bradyrhizobium sp. CB2312 TaxID=3039155 RepID=UPI0024B0B6CA|nr:AAA family ATPase [Bradyrhizobium sp. CB2312]WFU74873.1 AAA family ATPase [Bradyrhizobium sp. CB2312]
MIDLAKCTVERLRTDDMFVLYRAWGPSEPSSLLALVPRRQTIRSLEKLESEYALADDLKPAWAVLPIELVPHKENMMLVLDDPGGRPLATVIENPLDFDTRLHLATRLADSLDCLHRQGLFHCNLNPKNILVTEDNGVRLTGFWNARRQSQKDLGFSALAGALPYIAPEQTGRLKQPIDCRTDLYSLGVTLYELFTGSLPFSASTPEEWIHCHLARTPRPPGDRLAGLPEQVSAIVIKLLSKEPTDRFQSAGSLLADLKDCSAEWAAKRQIKRFPLARGDVGRSLRIPRKLYGRASEIAALRAIFDLVAEKGRSVLTLVSGPSGVGKTSLVAEFLSGIAPNAALVASAKLDIQMRDVPYAALTQAFDSLLRKLLTCDEEEVAAWRRTLTEATEPHGGILTEVIPAFEYVVGRQPHPTPAPQDRSHRLRVIFRKLIGAFGRRGHPLILFIDDLQWLDTATLELLNDLIVHRNLTDVMLIGAFRDNGTEPLHSYLLQIESIHAAGVPVEKLRLQPLASSDVSRLIVDSLGCRDNRVRPLANLIHSRTGGNPFFATQFLRTLNDDGLLAFDPSLGRWHWDLGRVRAMGFAENVASLMAAKLDLVPAETRRTLLHLACLGSSATLEDLATASGHPLHAVTTSLKPASRAGLISITSKYCSFVHDRVQEASYALCPSADRAALHLRIGMALANRTRPEDDASEHPYVVANQLNRGLSQVRSDDERDMIIAINHSAGLRARNTAAYGTAIIYLEVARNLLAEKSGSVDGPDAFAIELLHAECEFLVGRLDAAEGQLRTLSRRYPNLQAGAEVTRLRSHLYTTRAQLEEAVEVCLEFLRQVGIEWSAHPSRDEVDRERRVLRELANGVSRDELHRLPEMTNVDHLATMAVLADLVVPSFLTDRNLSDIMLLAAARLTLLHGICAEACYPLACIYGVLAVDANDAGLALRLSEFGAMLADQRPMNANSGRALYSFGYYVTPWVRPIRSGLPFIQRGKKTSLAAGDLANASYAHHAVIAVRLFCGDPLREIYKEAEQPHALPACPDFALAAEAWAVQKALVLGLIGHDEEDGLVIPGAETTAKDRDLSPPSAFFHYAGLVQQNMIAGRPRTAVALAEHAEKHSWCMRSYTEFADYRFYLGLSHAAAFDISTPEESDNHVAGLREQHRKMTTWATRNPANFAARHALLEAELARIDGHELKAEQLYESAIRLARESGFVHIEAIAAERAAQFYEARGIRTVVLSYLSIARDCYQRWGAVAKVSQLEHSNLHLPAFDRIRASLEPAEVTEQQLDINTLFTASRALSGVIELSTLVRTLMKVVIEHAAAERGILFLMSQSGPEGVAEAHLEPDDIGVTVWEGGVRNLAYSQPIVNYVIRTRTCFSSHESTKNLLSADPYLRQSPHLALHCQPIVFQAKLVGVLYLESHAAVGAFTPHRLALLDLLAAQAAVALENARLYTNLQRSEAFLAEGQSISHTGSWSWDAKNGEVLWSDEHYRMFGLHPDRQHAVNIASAFRTIHPEDRAGLRLLVQSSMRSGSSFTTECRLIRTDGIRHLQIVGRPSFDGTGRLLAYVGATSDLTDYRRAQDALAAAQSDLARASRLTAVGELTGLIAHEVRQPLSAIAARAGAWQHWLMRSSPNLERATIAAAEIAAYADRATAVIESIRQMARNASPTRSLLDINDAVKETVTLLGSEIRRQQVVLKLDFAIGLPMVWGDTVQLQQVVLNLMMNAVEAMALVEGRPRILSLCTGNDHSGRIKVAIADTGAGISSDATERLFEPFWTSKPNGLGVGLAICRSIIERHGGTLSCAPNQPYGTIFEFTLPQNSSQETSGASFLKPR